jgi:hypothetical protein
VRRAESKGWAGYGGGGGGAMGGPAVREREARSDGSFSVGAAAICCVQEEGRRGKRKEKKRKGRKKEKKKKSKNFLNLIFWEENKR